MSRVGLQIFGKKTTEAKYHFIKLHQDTCNQNDLILLTFTSTTWLRQCLSFFCKYCLDIYTLKLPLLIFYLGIMLGYIQMLLYSVTQLTSVLTIESSIIWLLCLFEIAFPISVGFAEERVSIHLLSDTTRCSRLFCVFHTQSQNQPFLQGAQTHLIGQWY